MGIKGIKDDKGIKGDKGALGLRMQTQRRKY